MTLKDWTPKKFAETLIDFFVTLVVISIVGSIVIPDDANLKAALPGLAVTMTAGLVTWKVMAAYKLIDKG